MKKNIIVVLCILLPISSLLAQAESYGTWSNLSVGKKINKKWDVDAEVELRTVGGNDVYFARLMERMSMGVSADYGIIKGWKVGAGYQIMNKLDTKYVNYQWRHRVNVFSTGRLKFNDLTISLREKIQLTTKDESNRIERDNDNNIKYLPDGSVNIDHYKINPEWKWRNRLQLSYNIPNCKITPTVSVESNFVLNDPDGNHFDKMRYILSLGYKIKKVHLIEVFGVMNDALNQEDGSSVGNTSDDIEYGKYNLGVGYKFSF